MILEKMTFFREKGRNILKIIFIKINQKRNKQLWLAQIFSKIEHVSRVFLAILH